MKFNYKVLLRPELIREKILRIVSNKQRLGKIILIIVILLLALVLRLNNEVKEDEKIKVETSEPISQVEMYVDISGEVENPGVYAVEENTRLYEVIDKAGGLTEDANTDQINQAGYVEDGEKIVIPSINIDSDDGAADSASEESYLGNGKININTASREQLMDIPGVGEVIAERILEYRKSNRFKNTEDIMNVKGIGNATYEKMKEKITT